jgi:hypothetical protein
MIIIPGGRYRAVIALVAVGGLLMLFCFQAIADGKSVDALESGIAGLLAIGGGIFLAKRTILRDAPARRARKVQWVDAHERSENEPR